MFSVEDETSEEPESSSSWLVSSSSDFVSEVVEKVLVVDGASEDPWEVLFDPVADELCELSSKREEVEGSSSITAAGWTPFWLWGSYRAWWHFSRMQSLWFWPRGMMPVLGSMIRSVSRRAGDKGTQEDEGWVCSRSREIPPWLSGRLHLWFSWGHCSENPQGSYSPNQLSFGKHIEGN